MSAHERAPWSLRSILLAEGLVLGLVAAAWVLLTLRHLELELVVAGVLALVIEPLVMRLERRGLPRLVAVVITVLLVLAVVVGLAVAFAVPLVRAGQHLLTELPSILSRLRAHRATVDAVLARLHLTHVLDAGAQSIARAAQLAITPAIGLASGAVGALGVLAVVATLAVFLSLEGPRARRWLLSSLQPQVAARTQALLHDVAVAVAGYVVGNLVTSLAAGLAVGITYVILGLPDAALVGLWVGLIDLLPLVGGLAGGVPAVALAFVGGVQDAAIVLAVVVAYQQLENHLLNPVVFARTVRLSPLWVLIAVLIGAQAASLPGALIAIPIASAAQVVARETIRDPLRRWLGSVGSRAVVSQRTEAPPAGADAGDELVEGSKGGKRSTWSARDIGVVEQERRSRIEPMGDVGDDGGRRGVEPPVAPPARPEHDP